MRQSWAGVNGTLTAQHSHCVRPADADGGSRGHAPPSLFAQREVLSHSADLAAVALIASPKRGKAVFQYLSDKGVSPEDLQRVKYPAGLNIGAVTAEEIALSITPPRIWCAATPQPTTRRRRPAPTRRSARRTGSGSGSRGEPGRSAPRKRFANDHSKGFEAS